MAGPLVMLLTWNGQDPPDWPIAQSPSSPREVVVFNRSPPNPQLLYVDIPTHAEFVFPRGQADSGIRLHLSADHSGLRCGFG